MVVSKYASDIQNKETGIVVVFFFYIFLIITDCMQTDVLFKISVVGKQILTEN